MEATDVRVAVFYPWGGLPARDRGAARRVVPMIEAIAAHFGLVTVLSPGRRSNDLQDRNIHYVFHEQPLWEKACCGLAWRLYDAVTHHLWRGKIGVRARRQWWHFLQPSLQPSLAGRIREIVSDSDVVMLEYPFWSALLQSAGKRDPKPVILTMHDLLSDIVGQPFLKSRVEAAELAACRRADAVVCCSSSDQARVRAMGVDAELVPHGIELAGPHDEPVSPRLGRLTGARHRGAMICFFVGSSLQPNRDAVEAIAAMAASLREEPRIFFAIAGACCGEMEFGPNMVSLGSLSEAELNSAYALSDVALAPITSGSGSSLKVLEALARGKTLVSTSVGVRGHGFVSGEQAILCDDLAKFPEILRQLFNDPSARRKLAENGRAHVRQFDSRTVYQPCVDLVGRLAGSQS